MKIGVLTSSRADYGIYKPLLRQLSMDDRFELHIIVFGTHLLEKFGLTINAIKEDDFGVIHQVSGMPESDNVIDITKGYGEIVIHFGEFWYKNKFDWALALGDRFEMSAAVQAGIPFEVNFAHLHGGETTLGAIDNIYRHQITLASKLHFTAAYIFKEKVTQIIGDEDNVYHVGALSLDDIDEIQLPSWNQVRDNFEIPDSPFALVTFHPETVGIAENEKYSRVVYETLSQLAERMSIVITLANADAMGTLYRERSSQLKKENPEAVHLIDNFGRENFFSALKESLFVLGNSSSSILEAASFGRYAINVGNRQKGRLQSGNIINVPFDKQAILDAVDMTINKKQYLGENAYYKTGTVHKIIATLANAEL